MSILPRHKISPFTVQQLTQVRMATGRLGAQHLGIGGIPFKTNKPRGGKNPWTSRAFQGEGNRQRIVELIVCQKVTASLSKVFQACFTINEGILQLCMPGEMAIEHPPSS